jgi:hypothetical protein
MIQGSIEAWFSGVFSSFTGKVFFLVILIHQLFSDHFCILNLRDHWGQSGRSVNFTYTASIIRVFNNKFQELLIINWGQIQGFVCEWFRDQLRLYFHMFFLKFWQSVFFILNINCSGIIFANWNWGILEVNQDNQSCLHSNKFYINNSGINQ